MLGRTLKMAFWVTYDHIGKLILANIVWFAAVFIPGSLGVTAFNTGDRFLAGFIGIPLLVLALGILHPVFTAGMAHMAKVLIETRDGAVSDMFRGVRLYGVRAACLGLVYLFAIVSFATSAWFYAVRLRASVPWLGYTISGVAVWGLVFALLSSLLAMPALVQKKEGVWTTLKLSGLLILANPFFSIGLAIQFLAFTAVSAVICAVVPLFYGAVAAVLFTSAYEMLARKYAVLESNADPARPAPPKDEEDDYLNRGFRDFLFPWKG